MNDRSQYAACPCGGIEQWRTVPGHEGRYEVSDHGRVWSNYPPGTMLRPAPTRGGYPGVSLLWKYQSRTVKVHQLVLTAFGSPRPAGSVTRHLDGSVTNNHIANLAWGDQKENALDRSLHGTENRGERNGQHRLTEPEVLAILALRGSGILQYEVAERFGISQVTVSNIWTRRTWKHLEPVNHVAAAGGLAMGGSAPFHTPASAPDSEATTLDPVSDTA